MQSKHEKKKSQKDIQSLNIKLKTSLNLIIKSQKGIQSLNIQLMTSLNLIMYKALMHQLNIAIKKS